ncbi:MAG: hypothetical protein JRN09_01815 [Nitrososphaerota archaeon]|nr:hypothetical protein [Nitrososphaerota archaeon]
MPGKKAQRRIIGGCFVKLSNLVDLGRLACALERAQLPIFMSKHGDKVRLSVQNDLFMGVPIFYYWESDSGGEFLAYKNNGENEEVLLLDSATTPSYIYSPIIHVLKLPSILEHKKEFSQKFLAAQVADLSSLVKLATYKMLYEEPPLPVYCFKNGTSWIVGAFARLDDYEEASLFFYTRIKEEPSTGFIKYSPSNLGETSFSKRADEHGFHYVKVIKLAEKHPLVEF